jgi:hypothetical protein
LTYSDTVDVQFNLTDFETLQDVVWAIKYMPFMGGPTRVSGALRVMVRLG